jgi:hypothetical protein
MTENHHDRYTTPELTDWPAPFTGCDGLSCDDNSCAVCQGWAADYVAEVEAEDARLQAIYDDPAWDVDAPAADCLNCGASFENQGARSRHFNLAACPATEFVPWVIDGKVRTPIRKVTTTP